MVESKIVVIGASAGGVEALIRLAETLPHDLDAAVLVVMHVSATAKSALPQILSRAQRLAATYPVDGQRLQAGRMYVAPPDWHMLLLNSKQITLSRGPREHSCRPAVDPLFRSAAAVFGPNAIGIILSGTMDDGTAGLQSIKDAGGTTIVQLPKDALFPGMPLNAIEHGSPDFIVSAGEIGPLVAQLCAQGQVNFKPSMDRINEQEVAIDALESSPEGTKSLGPPSEFGCPECGGTLWAISAGNDERYRCRVGHAYSAGSLMDEQTVAIEKALWTAYRALNEKADLAKRVCKRLSDNHHFEAALRFERQGITAEREAERIMELLRTRTDPPQEDMSELEDEIAKESTVAMQEQNIAKKRSIRDESL